MTFFLLKYVFKDYYFLVNNNKPGLTFQLN